MSKPDYLTNDKAKLSASCWADFFKRIDQCEPEINDQVRMLETAIRLRPCEYPKRDQIFFEIGFQYALICLEQGVIQISGSAN